MKNNQPLISVVVPVYNVKKYLFECLNSIIEQTYRNLEIICVNDGSTDGSECILEEFAKADNRIKVINLESNGGLFAARLTGIKEAKGEYICFVDSDDHVTIDWIRLMYVRAKEEDADIVISQFLDEIEKDNTKLLNRLNPLLLPIKYEGKECFDTFLAQHGSFYAWSVVWNKLYRLDLFKKSISELTKFAEVHPHFTMCEDVVFSFAVWSKATKVTNVTLSDGTEFYYYRRRDNSSISLTNDDINSTKSKISNLLDSFEFAKKIIAKYRVFDDVAAANIKKWKLFFATAYFKQYKNNSVMSKYLFERFEIDSFQDVEDSDEADSFFFKNTSIYNTWYIERSEDLKKRIVSSDSEVVSFDIFDTLILRPFFYPTDLFVLLTDEFQKLFGMKTTVNFLALRIESEARARSAKRVTDPMSEEVTIDEIYNQLAKDYSLSPEKVAVIKEKEIELELRYCYPRKSGKYLYDLARDYGKKIIFTSDMYLSKATVEKLLLKNGYAEGELFLSSDLGVCKYSGNLFRYIEKHLKIKKNRFLHIGDNYDSDFLVPKKNGWYACHFPKVADLYWSHLDKMLRNEGRPHDIRLAFNLYPGMRNVFALIANKLFDNPFVDIAQNTDYDSNAYNIGYSTFGPYLFAITDWAIKSALEKGKNNIQYVSRDGYIPMKAQEIFEKYYTGLPSKNYLCISRKSLLLIDVYSKSDLVSLREKFNCKNYSPLKFMHFVKPFLKFGVDEILNKIGIGEPASNEKFSDALSFVYFTNKIADYIDFNLMNKEKKELKQYFEQYITPKSIMFDVGYSGRAEAALTQLLGFPLDSLYLHTNTDIAEMRMKNFNFNITCFYDYKPKMTGLVREHVLMKLGPSTIGYKKINGKYEPEFEDKQMNFESIFVTSSFQQGALDFVQDYLEIFHDCPCNYVRRHDMVFPFEYYINYGETDDRRIFACVPFEDDFGLGNKTNLFTQWNKEMEMSLTNGQYHGYVDSSNYILTWENDALVPFAPGIRKMSRAKRVMYMMLFDRPLLRQKLRNRRSRK